MEQQTRAQCEANRQDDPNASDKKRVDPCTQTNSNMFNIVGPGYPFEDALASNYESAPAMSLAASVLLQLRIARMKHTQDPH